MGSAGTRVPFERRHTSETRCAARRDSGGGLLSTAVVYGILFCSVFALPGCGGNATVEPGSATGGTGGGANGDSGVPDAGGGVPAGPESVALDGGIVWDDAAAPVDPRPPRPDWTPPFSLGPAGWRESTVPFCAPYAGSAAGFGVWADSRGVFALASSDPCPPTIGAGGCGIELPGTSLQFNDGKGWRTLLQVEPGNAWGLEFTGFPNGPLVIRGGKCGISFVENGIATCSRSTSMEMGAVFVVNDTLAYAIDGQWVLKYAGGNWSTVASIPTAPSAIWADESTIVVAGSDQAVYAKTSDSAGFAPLPDVPAGSYTSAWGFGPHDLWFGNSGGQLAHYDGTAWQVVPTGTRSATNPAVYEMWGSGGTLYFGTVLEVGRWRNGTVDLVLSPPADADVAVFPASITGLWGLSASEVFVSVSDNRYTQYACGGSFVIWFDGSVWHEY
jgi:hypothetical protein